jgi:RHS repeat-associated protein
VGLLARYEYDDLGAMTRLTRGNGAVTSYGHDALSRLTVLAHDLAGSANDVTTGFSYTPASQIAATTRSNDSYAWFGHYNVDRPYAINGLNQVTSAGATALGYDGRGNLTRSGGVTYSYGQRNQLVTVPSGTLYHDPLGRLVQSFLSASATGTEFDYDGDHLSTEFNLTGATLRRYVFGPGADAPIVWYEGAGVTDRRWLIADERGSIVAVTDQSGAAFNINRYDEYGIPAPYNLGRFGYTGQAWLPEVGLYYYKARFYSPTLGRFLQTDPIGFGDGVNWYNYVGGDPVNKSDPSGLGTLENGEGTVDIVVQAFNRGWAAVGFNRPQVVLPGQYDGGSGFNPTGNTIINAEEIVITAKKRLRRGLRKILRQIRNFVCSLPGLDIGIGVDGYFGIGASVGGGIKVDIASGQVGAGANIAVGAGAGLEAGSSVGVSPSGSGVVSANVTTSAGGGSGVGVVVTHNIIGTDPGQTSVSAGRVGTPIGFINGGAAIGFSTPKTNFFGCK